MSIDVKDSLYLKDKIFKKIVQAIIPNTISDDNKASIDGFVDILSNLSPISINITDVFYKRKTSLDPILNNKNTNYIKGVQNQMNSIFMNDFWKIFNKYSHNYIIYHKIQEMLSEYDGIGGINPNMDFEFFKLFDSMFTEEKYISGREFKIRKGTKTATEFAYKSIWKAKVEGVFQEDYLFEFSDEFGNSDNMTEGSCINPNPPVCTDPVNCDCIESGQRIGTWLISNNIGTTIHKKMPYYYEVKGSLLPIFYHTMVRNLSHPVGYDMNYSRIFETTWEDYFNTFLPISVDSLVIKSLCYENDCNNPNIDYYITQGNPKPIINGELYKIENINNSLNEFNDYDITKYLFTTGQFILEYKQNVNLGLQTKTIIEYYGNDFTNYTQLLNNSEFDLNTDWSYGSRWNIDTNNGIAILSGSGIDSIMSNEYDFLENTKYIIEIKINDIYGELNASIENSSIKINTIGTHVLRYISYSNNTLDVILQDTYEDSSCVVEYVRLYVDKPNKRYNESSHSSVLMENFKRLSPILLTYDDMEFSQTYLDEDILNDNLSQIPDEKYPIIGKNIIIGTSGSNNSKLVFKTGCYNFDIDRVIYPPYTTPYGCCEANVPYNPGSSCVFGELIPNNPNLKYISDNLETIETSNRVMKNIINNTGFDNTWQIISGNATISNGVLSQDGAEESVIEKVFDICPINDDMFIVQYNTLPGNIGTVTKAVFTYVSDIDLVSTELGENVLKWGWIIEGSNCSDNPKIRITLPIDYDIPLTNIEIYKY